MLGIIVLFSLPGCSSNTIDRLLWVSGLIFEEVWIGDSRSAGAASPADSFWEHFCRSRSHSTSILSTSPHNHSSYSLELLRLRICLDIAAHPEGLRQEKGAFLFSAQKTASDRRTDPISPFVEERDGFKRHVERSFLRDSIPNPVTAVWIRERHLAASTTTTALYDGLSSTQCLVDSNCLTVLRSETKALDT